MCNECRQRGLTCVDQGHGSVGVNEPTRHAEPSYSLRERVTRLEGIVGDILKGLDDGGISKSSSSLLTPKEEAIQC